MVPGIREICKKRGGKMKKTVALCGVVLLLSACQPEVGSDKWCEALEVRDKGEWTLNEAKDFAKHCVFN